MIAEAGDGRQAVALAAELDPDIVVLDLSMPEINGLEAARRIIAANPTMRILILTAHESEQIVREVLSTGAQGYLLKSDAGRTLVAALQALLEGRTYFTSNVARMILKGYLRNAADGPGAEPTLSARPPARNSECVESVLYLWVQAQKRADARQSGLCRFAQSIGR